MGDAEALHDPSPLPELVDARSGPIERYAAIADHLAFYAQRVDRCVVDGEDVQPMDGTFYGGWITSKVVGPFKGGAGTAGW